MLTNFLTAVVRDELRSLSATRYSSPPRSCGGASDDLVAASDCYQQERNAFVPAVRRELGTG